MTTPLREELDRLADTQSFSPDPTAWDRGRRARRRSRVAAGVAALALVAGLGGLGALAVRPDTVAPADVVPEGAIPSRIVDEGTSGPAETDFAIGRASVAFISQVTNLPVVIGAEDGRYHHLDTSPPLALALSPDGGRLAMAMPDRLHVIDLESGEVLRFPHDAGRGARVSSLTWLPDSQRVVWRGSEAGSERSRVAGMLDVPGRTGSPVPWKRSRGVLSPGGTITVMGSNGADAVFEVGRPYGSDRPRLRLERPLPADLYPDGAIVTPLGWADDHLVLAQVYSGPGSYVEGQHLALFTSPDRPKAEWTYRIVTRDVPQNALPLSVAVDLVPDLDGTSSQPLTHDFGSTEPDPWRERAPYLLGGLLALLAGLALVRMVRHRA